MGVSSKSRSESKEYAIVVVYATKVDKVLDITTASNVKCYTWSLFKRLEEQNKKYTPTNKVLKFVKRKMTDVTDIKVVHLDTFYGNYADAKKQLNEVSSKINISTIDDCDSGADDEIKQLKSQIAPAQPTSDVEIDADALNSVIETADSETPKAATIVEKPFYCELTNKYFATKSSLTKHITHSKEYKIALLASQPPTAE